MTAASRIAGISGIPAQTRFFIGDNNPQNCEAAVAFDMQAIRVESHAQLRYELA